MTNFRACVRGALVCALLASASTPAPAAQAGKAPELPVVPIQWLQKQPHPDAGKVALYKGETDAVGIAFTIPPGTVFSRCAIVVAALEPGKPVSVFLKNELSTKWDRTATTDARGIAEIKYRTEGTAMVMVRSPQGRQAFQLMVLQGRELPVHKLMRPPFVDRAQYEASQGAGRPAQPAAANTATTAPPANPPAAAADSASAFNASALALWFIVGLLAALLVVGILHLFKKRST